MDIQKIAHIGTEGVLFIGMFVYFNNQIKQLKKENEELQNKLGTLHENTNKQLNNIYMILDTFKNSMTPSPIEIRQVPKSNQPQKGMGLKQRKVNQEPKSKPVVQQLSRKVKFQEHDPEDDLDAELGEELQELEEEEEELESKEIDNTYNNGKKK